MPESERAICARLRKFRHATGLSQADFAQLVGLDARVYASYEYARSRLNYPAAWRILNAFRLLNPGWLAEGKGMPFGVFFAPYGSPEETGLGPRALFSLVYERFLKSRFVSSQGLSIIPADQPLPYFTISPNMQGRVAAKDVLAELTVDWLAAQPDCQLSDFVNGLLQAGATLLRKYPPEHGAARKRRFTELFQIEAKRRSVLPAFLDDEKKGVLTEVTPERNVAGMTEIALLLQRLKRALEGVRKGDLARSLKVPLPRVSEWLSGRVVPSGETALRLLHWVEQRERAPKTLGSPTKITKGKAQIRKSSI